MFIEKCPEAMAHATYDKNGDFVGVNMHGIEKCRGFGLVTRDPLYVKFKH